MLFSDRVVGAGRRLMRGVSGLLVVLACCLPARGKSGDSLWVLPLDGEASRRLVVHEEMHAGSPRWSPDGQWIAYDTAPFDDRQRKTCRVHVVSLDGKTVHEVGLGGMPAWSAEGSDLAWHTYYSGGVVTARFDSETAAVSNRRLAVSHWGNPNWLPDGRLITIDGGGLSYFDPKTRRESPALKVTGRIPHGYSVSPDGSSVVFRQTGESEPEGLVIAKLRGSDGKRGWRLNPRVVRLDGGDLEYASWSPDGRRIVFSWRRPNEKVYQLYTLGVYEGEPVRIPGQDPEASSLQPDFSPDGESVVYRRVVRNLVPRGMFRPRR